MTAPVHGFPPRLKHRSDEARVWLLLSNRLGDNNQLYALAEALGLPFSARGLLHNPLKRLPMFRRATLSTVRPESRELIKAPWPELVISAGYPSVPVARYIRDASGGRTKIVHVGNARSDVGDFDLHLTTPQYASSKSQNSVELPFPIGNPARDTRPTFKELDWLSEFERPRRLVAVGGRARHWELDRAALTHAIGAIRSKEPSGSLIIATSARTRDTTDRLLRTLLHDGDAIVTTFPRFGVLLSRADEIYVTADSVSMISEAVLTGKPVGMIPIRRSARGRIAQRLLEPLGIATVPDFTNFWKMLDEDKLIGPVELPVACQVCDTVDRAVAAVRSLLVPGDAVDEGRAERDVADLGFARRTSGRQRAGHRTRRIPRHAVRDKAARI